MLRLGGRSDIFVALFVVAVTALFLMHVPAFVIDLLIVFNLATAILLLLTALYVPNPARLYAFPTILLLSTLFRLGLNVATTRLILLEGYAGDVIQTFGQFLIQGEVIVGIVIFSIITIVSYIVVSKGASRVAEVAARFTLDSLPVKQMAIESDMRAGILTAQESYRLREELRQESQLYGSMDGAMKFVQGDVIAGIIIIFTNIFGGLYVGISNGLSLVDAVQTYTILTVGDGLVSQIPSLMVAICAGILVTRITSSTESTLGADLGHQLLKRPEAWALSGIIMVVGSLVPGLPFIPFALGGATFLLVAYFGPRVFNSPQAVVVAGRAPNFSMLERSRAERTPLGISWNGTQIGSRHIFLELDADSLFRQYLRDQEQISKSWIELQQLFFTEIGLDLPSLKVIARVDLERNSYRVSNGKVNLLDGTLPLDSFFVNLHPNSASMFNIPVVKQELNPVTGAIGFWTTNQFDSFSVLQAAELEYCDQIEFVIQRIAGYLKVHPEELISVSDMYEMVKDLTAKYPGLISGLMDPGVITVPRLSKIVQQLAKEGIFVGDLRFILESLAEYYSRFDNIQEVQFVLDDAVNTVRKARKKEFVQSFYSSRNTIRVISVSPEVENRLADLVTRSDVSDGLKISREQLQEFKAGLSSSTLAAYSKGIAPRVVICNSHLKSSLVELLMLMGESLCVVIDDEIDPGIKVEEVAEWRVKEL